MPALNQPVFRTNAIKHYMEGREKHAFPHFVSLPVTILLWTLLILFLAVGAWVWGEQVPTYTTTQGVVVVQSANQPSEKSVSAARKQVPAPGKSISVPSKKILPTAIAIFFFPRVQVQSLHTGMPVRLHIGLSGLQVNSKITRIDPDVMSPVALRSLFHLDSASLPITQPSAVVIVKLDPTFAIAYAGSTLTVDVQVGSQSLLSLLPGI